MTDENKGWNNGPSMWASLCHFSALLGAVWWIPVKGMWIPCGQIIAPLGVWLIKRKTSPFVDLSGRMSLNFQITITALVILLIFLLPGFLKLIAGWSLVIFDLFCIIRAGVRTSEGELYRYPIPTIPLFRTSALWELLSVLESKGQKPH